MAEIDTRVGTVREFNRYYTRRVGALGAHLGSEYSLTEVRVLYELAHRESSTASEIAESLDLDRGYLSRLLRSFKKRGLIRTAASKDDRRQTHLRLTPAGRRAFAPLDKRADANVVEMLETLSPEQQRRVVGAMSDIRSLLARDETPSDKAFTIRTHRPGDMGWITYRHGVLYWREYGWDERFEAIVARVVADFIANFDRARERCWIAERHGEIVGSVFIVAKTKAVAKLRLLLVEPSARGLGIGSRLVHELIQFARRVGYKRIELWTHPELVSARKIYKAAGFELVAEETHSLFGKALTAETWSLRL